MSFFIPAAMAEAPAAAPASQGSMSGLFLMIGMFVFMWFFLIQPQRKRQKEHQKLVSALSKGDEVVMNSGLLAKITKVDEEYVSVNPGNDSELRFQKASVHAVLPKGTIKSIS